MVSRILKIILPTDIITPDNLKKIQKITEATTLHVVRNNVVVVEFEFGMSLSKLNDYAIKISAELYCELYSIFQNSCNCTINYL